MEFINGSGQVFNTIHANTFEFYEELHRVIDREPVEIIDPETRGLIASIGIRKGKPFEPDQRTARNPRRRRRRGQRHGPHLVLPDQRRRTTSSTKAATGSAASSVATTSSCWTESGGERNLDARTALFYMATLNTPAMTMKMVGAGSQYAWGDRDSSGNYLDGAKSYRLTLPPNVPAKNFWSVVVYDPQTRSELQTGQPYPEQEQPDRRPRRKLRWFDRPVLRPEAPEGFESNWTQTVPGKGWFTLLRLYGPLEPWFDQTWRPGEFEMI